MSRIHDEYMSGDSLDEKLMTGREWYERWQEILAHKMFTSKSSAMYQLCNAAAKRAAGIKEQADD